MVVDILAQAVPSDTGTSMLVYILGTGLLLSLIALLFQFYMFSGRERHQDRFIVFTARKAAVSAAVELLEEYKIDLAIAREDLEKIFLRFNAAVDRTTALQKDLDNSQGNCSAIQNELTEAIRLRTIVEKELVVVKARIRKLEDIIQGRTIDAREAMADVN